MPLLRLNKTKMNAIHLIFLLGVFGQAESRAVKAPDQESKTEAAERLAFMKKSANAFRISFGSDRAGTVLKLHPDPILRSSNAMGHSNGGLFLWTINGRPEAVAEIVFFMKQKRWMHNLQSLSMQKLFAQRDGKPIWTPSNAGIELKLFKDAALPAEAKPDRLRQMKSLARHFGATVTTKHSGKNELRLLARPLYRYESTDSDVLDGALFCMVLGTSAEAILLLEARKSSDDTRWHYGLAPLSPCSTVATYKDQQVWSVPFRRFPQPRDCAFFSYRLIQ